MKKAHLDTWMRVFENWVRKGADRSYAVWMADRAQKRAQRKPRKTRNFIAKGLDSAL